ncbi:MAG: TetR/AcrR family transcriptional regulator [Acidimicrobiales bacterium]
MAEQRSLTEKQEQRRRRVLLAAIELAAEGGYDGVQMRAVAERADVALGTVYHYFSSKDHLLAASMTEWLSGLEASVARRPAGGATTLERVLDILGRTTRAMAENPKVSAAVIGGLIAEGPHGAPSQETLHVMFSAMLRSAFTADYPAERREKIIRSLEHIWFSELIAWKNGWNPYDQGARELEDAAELFLLDADG